MSPKPITARECADAGMMLRVMCRCGHESHMEPELVAFMLGEDFPLATSLSAVSWSINCGACNNPRPVIVFADEAEEVEQALEFVLRRPSRQIAVGEVAVADLASLRLDAYQPSELGIDCSRCHRRAFASTAKLGARYGKTMTLGELARLVASEGNPPCTLAAVEGNVLCGAIPVEPPIETWADLGQAFHGRWVALLQCGRRHAAMKSTKSCPGPITLDVETLVASLGHDQTLDRLPFRLRCPSCGTKAIHLESLIPPPAPPPEPMAGAARATEGERLHRPARRVTSRALRVMGGKG